jgi:uncharacterized protein YggE
MLAIPARPALAAALLASLVAVAPRAILAQQPGAAEAPQIVVTGFGEVSVAPDKASIDVAVETRASTASAAASLNARRLRAVLDTLKGRGVAQADLATVGFSVHQDYEQVARGAAPRRMYVATNVVRVDTRDLERVGALLDAALDAGANRINEVRFSSTRHLAVRDSAMTIAITNARRSAEGMARAAGGRLGVLLELSTQINPYAIRENMTRASGGYASGAVANQSTSISPDQLEVGTTVIARWRFEPAR